MTRNGGSVLYDRLCILRRRLIMARYTCSFTVAAPRDRLRQLFGDFLQTYNLEIIYNTADYMMAREVPGHVSFTKLVTVEVLIDRTTAIATETHINLVVKNEELPLQVENHCHQMFELMNQGIVENRNWQLIEIESVPG